MENKGFGFEKPQEIHYGNESYEIANGPERMTETEKPQNVPEVMEAKLREQIGAIPESQLSPVRSGEVSLESGRDPETVRVMKIAETKGVAAAISEIQKDSPEIIDEFHDELMGKIQH